MRSVDSSSPSFCGEFPLRGGGWGGRGWSGRGASPRGGGGGGGGGRGRRDPRGMQRPTTLSLAPPFSFSDPAASSPPAAAVSSFGDQSPPARPSGSPSASPGRGPSSLVSYILSHVKMPHCPMSAAPYVDRPTLAGALKQHQDTAQHTSDTHIDNNTTATVAGSNGQQQPQAMVDSSAAINQQPQPHSSYLPSHTHPYSRSLHPPHHRGSLPLPLSMASSVPLSPHPMSIGGAWQPVSRSIPIAYPNPTAYSHAPFASTSSSSSFSSSSASPVLSASGLHRSQSDSVKLNHTYSLPPPRTSPLPNPPSPAFPSSTASNSSSLSHSQLSTSYDGMSLSPHPSPTGPLARSSSDPLADTRRDSIEAEPAATQPSATAISASPQHSLAIDVTSHSLLSPSPSPNSTVPLPNTAAPSLSPTSLSFLEHPMKTWTADQVWTWLHHLNLGQYTLFHLRSIDGDMLLDMTDEDLRTELGVDDKFHRGKIRKRIKEHTDKQNESTAAPSADERKEKRDRKASRFQRYRPRASAHHADRTTHSPSPHIVQRQMPQPNAANTLREHHTLDGTSSSDRYDYYVMQYEVLAALDDEQQREDGDRWEQKTHSPYTAEYAHAHNSTGESPSALTRRSGAEHEAGAAIAVDEADRSMRAHDARVGGLDSPISSSGSDDEAEEEEREKQRRERHRRRLHRRVSHDKYHQTLSPPHSQQGNIHRSHSAALSTYWPAVQPPTATLEHSDVGKRDIQTQQQQQQQQVSHSTITAATTTATTSAPPPLPAASAPLQGSTQPLAANLSMVSAAFASLSASSASQPQSSNRHAAATSRTPASSSLYPPAQQTVKPSMSVDSLSSTLHAGHSHRSPLSLPPQHSSHSPQSTHAPALSPLPHSHTSSHQQPLPSTQSAHFHSHTSSLPPHPHPHQHSLPHPHHHSSQSLSAAGAAPAVVPSRIDRLSSVLRSSPTFIDEVTNLTILSSGVAGHAYSGSFHSLPVVVKLPKTLEISGQEWREWQCHMRLPPHPNLVRFVGALVMQENNYLVTELIRQGSLKGVLAAGGAADSPLGVYSSGYAVLRAALDIGRGLSHMHRHRLVHRDISSRNILVDGDGTFVIADLGLCREMNKHDSAAEAAVAGAGGEGGNSTSSSDQYEMSRSTAIPVRWTSPEALVTSSYTSKSDVWALGVTLWEMTTAGAVPYQWVEGNRRLIQRVVDGSAQLSVDSHWERTADIGRRARNIIQLCLRRDADDRPNSSQLVEMVEAEMEQWEREAAEEAQRHRDAWTTHHEQLRARWDVDAQETMEREGAKHQQLMHAATSDEAKQARHIGGSAATATAEAIAAPAASSPTPVPSLDEDDEQRGLELMQPPQQRSTSRVSPSAVSSSVGGR